MKLWRYFLIIYVIVPHWPHIYGAPPPKKNNNKKHTKKQGLNLTIFLATNAIMSLTKIFYFKFGFHVGYLMPKTSFWNSSDTIYPIAGRYMGVHTFPKDISLKVSNANKVVPHIVQNWSLTIRCRLVSYLTPTFLGEGY